MFYKIHLWSHLVPDFCMLGVFLTTHSVLLLVIGLFIFSIPVLIFGDYIFLGICPFLLGCPFYWYILKIALLRDNLYTIKFTHFKFTVHWVFANLLSCVTIIIIQFRKFCHNPPKKKEKKKKKRKFESEKRLESICSQSYSHPQQICLLSV